MSQDQAQNDIDEGHDGTGKNEKQAMVPLHQDFTPGGHDVICGRGKKCYAHTGNERFRRIVQSHLDQYSAATSRPEKSEILSSIVSQVRKNSPDGGFVKQDTNTGTWYEVGDFLAREKTSQAFRDALHEHYRSSKKSKHEKRRRRAQAKNLSEKQTAKAAPEGNQDQHEVLYPSPLVSRQQLTVLREEVTHPRAFSFSGQSHEHSLRVREMPSRALSLSSGRGGGRITALSLRLTPDQQEYDVSHREPYRRPDSAPLPGFDQPYRADDLAVEIEPQLLEQREAGHESWPQPYRTSTRYPADDLAVGTEPRLQEQLEAGHESWPQPHRTSTRSLFAPPSAPQFHPVQAEDVAAHRLHSDDADAVMSEVYNTRARSSSTQLGRLSGAEWQGAGQVQSRKQMQGPREDTRGSPSQGIDAPTPLSAFSSTPNLASTSFGSAQRSSKAADAIHRRTDSTASATVIVAHLTSALQPESLAPDENPFEPIPLAGRSKKKPKTDRGDHQKW